MNVHRTAALFSCGENADENAVTQGCMVSRAGKTSITPASARHATVRSCTQPAAMLESCAHLCYKRCLAICAHGFLLCE